MFLEDAGEIVTGKPASLIGIEYLWRPVKRDCLFEGIDAE
jgi:hypothetical protein